MVIPPGNAQLRFWMRIGEVSPPFSDVFSVKVDNQTVQTFQEPSAAEPNYTERVIDLSSFADGNIHNITLAYHGDSNANFAVDDVTLVDSNAPVLLEVEPNNTSETAQVLSNTEGLELVGRIAPTGNDIDFYQFDAAAGDRIWVYGYTLGALGGNDLQLTLTDAASNPIQFDDDNGSQDVLSAAIAGAIIPATGTYQLKVNSGYFASIDPYRLFIDRTSGAAIPEVEPNDSMASANPINIGSVISAAPARNQR